ncbi:MAG: methyltransferase domain-containing protein [Planctomycetia bacterium]
MSRSWSVAQSRSPELMDDPALDAGEHLEALTALARINAISRTAAQLAAGVRRLASARQRVAGPIHVVDVACGGGDVTVDLARRLGPGYRVTGIDMSPRAVERAAEHAARHSVATASFSVCDVLASACPPCDVAVSSLFFHHLDDGAAADVLRGMATAAATGGVVSDLVRSRRGLALAFLATYVLTTSRVARIDGPLSVRAARTLDEYRRLVTDAGLADARIRRVWPERAIIEWTTTAVGGRA